MTNSWADAGEAYCNDERNGINIMTEAQRQQQEQMACCQTCLQFMVKLWHISDGILGSFLTIYGLFLVSSHLPVAFGLTLGMGVLLLLRALSGLGSLSSDALNRFGLRLSGLYVSPLLGIMFLILSFLCMGNHAVLMDYLQTHESQLHLSRRIVTFLQQHHHALWIVLLVAALLELIRWWTVPILLQWLLQMDTSLGSPDVELLYTPAISPLSSWRKRPWWWQSSSLSSSPHQQYHSNNNNHHDLHESLLEPHWVHLGNNRSRNYSIEDGIHNNPTANDSFWSRWFGRVKSPESTDFASVQEEWASKSEEDPFWWSREEEETPVKNTTSKSVHKTITSNQEDTSLGTRGRGSE